MYPLNLQNNRTVAERRLELLKKQLRREPQLHKKYKQSMHDLLSKDFARKVDTQESGPLSMFWYLPHHPVFNPQKPGKIIVVFDGSAKHCGTSLNDQLLQGPDPTNSLVGVLSRFREEQIALCQMSKRCFNHFEFVLATVTPLGFLWWPDGNLDSQPEEY